MLNQLQKSLPNELEQPLTLPDKDRLNPEEEEELEALVLLEEEDLQILPEEEDPLALQEVPNHHPFPLPK